MADVTNRMRADWAADGLRAFAEKTSSVSNFCLNPQEVAGDFLCDLLHWADQKGLSFNKMLEDARDLYLTELFEDK